MAQLFWFCLLAISSVFAAEQSPAPSNAVPTETPQITFEETRHDFGRVEPAKLEYTFKVKNTGKATLQITEVKPACHCTVATNFPRRLEPGAQGIIQAELNTFGMRNRVEKTIDVTSNDPKTPRVRLTLYAEMKEDLTVKPSRDIWVKVTPGIETNQTIEIRSWLEEPLQIKGVESGAPEWLSGKVVDSTTNSARVTIAAKGVAGWYGRKTGQIIIQTGYEKEQNKKVIITVIADAAKPIKVSPANLLFPAKQAKALSLRIARSDGKSFHISKIECPTLTIEATISPDESGQSYRINVSYTPRDNQPAANGKIEIMTDEPSQPKIEVPYEFK